MTLNLRITPELTFVPDTSISYGAHIASILETLEIEEPELADEIRKKMFVFEDILLLDDRAIQRVLRDVDNNDLAKIVDTNDEWIRERTGVIRRHIIEDETTVSMAASAASRALESSNTSAEEIDLIIVSTISPNVFLPCVACEVQKIIGAVNATCFDLNAACTGFVFGYNTALAYLESGMYKKALVIGSEGLSKLTDWTDRGTCILFGDGAGAVVVEACEGNAYMGITHSDGNKSDALTCKSKYFTIEGDDDVGDGLIEEVFVRYGDAGIVDAVTYKCGQLAAAEEGVVKYLVGYQ